MRHIRRFLLIAPFIASAAYFGTVCDVAAQSDDTRTFDFMVPDLSKMKPLAEQTPIVFVSRAANKADWDKLPGYWNETTDTAGAKVLKVKLPLGINLVPPVPSENPMTLARWKLGKQLYFDPILSSDGKVSCATCHAPEKGFSDASKTSTGISGKLGGMNAPTVLNSAFNRFQFWDGRADSLESQAQGPVGNNVEMFSGEGNAWHSAVRRMLDRPEYQKQFMDAFGHPATRDAAAKAIATYERTVLVGNSLHDRAEVAMRKRVEDEEGNKFELSAKDYEKVIKDAFAAKDKPNLAAIGLDADNDADKAAEVGKRVDAGRILFFNKARCSNCHVGENFTDHTFHNLGVGAKDGKVPDEQLGRFGSLATGHKDATFLGAFKTPALRGLKESKPYMHDGSEATLEAVVEFYDKGGNVNEFLDTKMRDVVAEEVWIKAKNAGMKYDGPAPAMMTRDGRPVIPAKLNLTPQEKADLVLFLKALEGDPVDPMVADPKK